MLLSCIYMLPKSSQNDNHCYFIFPLSGSKDIYSQKDTTLHLPEGGMQLSV